MNIYLKHPIHGQKVAVLEAEAKADELRGWQRFDPNVIAPSPDPIAVTKAEMPEKRKPGRPRKVE